MSNKQLVKPKTETKTEITTEQSQKLLQTMLTMSFGCLAFLRGLFPDDIFVDQRFVPEKVEKNYNKQATSQNNSIKIKTLVRGKSSQVDLLLDWLEKGVFKSIRLKCLKALSLGIFLEDPTDLLENYIFSFNYDEANNVNISVDLGDDKKENKNISEENETISLLDSRKMVQQLMRRFIIITQSLEPLPQKKFLTMRLMFNDNADEDYQPELFKDATFDKRATLRVPTNLDSDAFDVGTLNTKHHKVALSVLSAATSAMEKAEGTNFIRVDPFEIILHQQEQSQRDKSIPAKPQSFVTSQTTNVLGDLLNSSQASIQPTQFVVNNPATSLCSCECELEVPKAATVLKTCKSCRKTLHGICYGNFLHSSIEKCFSCIFGPSLDTKWCKFQDLMMIRKVFRFLVRKKKGFPASITELINSFINPKDQNNELKERVIFALFVFFLDETLCLDNGGKPSQTIRYVTSSVLVDVKGIVTPHNKKPLKANHEYIWRFTTSSPKAESFYQEVLPNSRRQIESWLDDITNLRKLYADALSPSSTLQELDLNSSLPTQDPIIIGQKRKHYNLDEYLQDDKSSVIEDTVKAKDFDENVPAKIRKISVSKKTLKSNW
ncbi:hypothetical protein SKDZ_09G0940 [Saccharomyces kudriavzevii ZP591]|uniref:HOP1-like protein n=2 Tax=Saccharomyces kudriavzevii (strain ATCC MYA-4449 / AS 2.2408 / CBS 8840 / NBRC 1802 / NCYC 2889) TaxID=226230 RepID=J5PEJ7_SACK1|nr:uncharacterized protein SKDI_09G0930 [Saccharomyces kudriavzevii IFO 1802]EJT42208.1 HOP1-like protein [Saccharomyces kudriavzevii IFO 1802]CAI4064612.1 hypothetical protein SKDZ_09G0940 [Saccharomyces kudriavzevii ZP591]CAI4064626.1 hypothetical protein SKDI_09G0930 [Saccharomyces kudriavzevii IFO 1802]